MPTFTADQLNELSLAMFKAAGATDEEAKVVTDSLIWASLRGHDSHGIGHLAIYTRYFGAQAGEGRVKLCGPFRPYRIVRETPATVAIDANWCMGQKVAMDATEMVIAKAKNTGIAAATIANSLHNGANAYYVSRIVNHDMIGIMCTLAGAASPPWGGLERMLGTNPIAFGIPAKEEYPIIIDMTTSSTSWAGIRPLLTSGKPLPLGLILNSEGEPSTDPKEFTFGAGGAQGCLDNMASNPKGYALQLAVEMLGGILGGLLTGNQVVAEGRLTNPALIIAINISFFQDLNAFKDKVDARIREIRASKKKRAVEAIYLPGERSARTQEKRLREGIPVHEAYWQDIVKAAEALGIDLDSTIAVAT